MRKFAPQLALAVAIPALALGAVWWRHHAAEQAIWRDVTSLVPAAPLSASSTNTLTKTDWLFGSSTGTYEVGQVVLRDGEVWRFAFASHHVVSGPDSYTVFRSPRGTIRARGDAFCCEVEFGDHKQPADTQEFIALLRSRGNEVEMLR
jgi:hypothetical protein